MRPEKLSTQQSLMQLPVCRVSSRQPGQWPQTPSDKSEWCRVILLISFFACKSYDILIWVICQNFALVHCHLESWTIQTIEFRSVMAMRFMTLGLLPRVPESTLVGACVNYCVCRQWSNQEQLDHRFGGIAHNNCLWGELSSSTCHVGPAWFCRLWCRFFFISMWLGPLCRNGLTGIVASAHSPQQLKTQVEPLALHPRLRPRDTHAHTHTICMYIYIYVHTQMMCVYIYNIYI